MAKQDAKHPNSFADLSALFSINGAMSDAVARMTKSCTKDLMEYQRELTKFVSDRWAADLEFQRSMTECQNLADMAGMQQQWLSKTISDYSAEAAKVADFIQTSARDGLEAWTKILSASAAQHAQATEATKPAAE